MHLCWEGKLRVHEGERPLPNMALVTADTCAWQFPQKNRHFCSEVVQPPMHMISAKYRLIIHSHFLE